MELARFCFHEKYVHTMWPSWMFTIGSAIQSFAKYSSLILRFAPTEEQGCPPLAPGSIQKFESVKSLSQIAMMDLERVNGRLTLLFPVCSAIRREFRSSEVI